MTMRRWLVVMWACELVLYAATMAGAYAGVRHGWPWYVAVGFVAAGTAVAELLLAVWRRWCPQPSPSRRSSDGLRRLVAIVRAVRWTGPGSSAWAARKSGGR
ncbi:hypothetical protein AB0D12_34035 [Streptomyces sp. NPDC048479]|uniref:hypothetical protein n=1 Tax=Streptomyces sp. NPDC048479 TaxID=3154725 RepID=UPI0034478573